MVDSSRFHPRPNGYNNTEWLSYIYHILIGCSSIEKDRRAPADFLSKYLPRVSSKDIYLEESLFNEISLSCPNIYNLIAICKSNFT